MAIMIGYHQHQRYRHTKRTTPAQLFSSLKYNLTFSTILLIAAIISHRCCHTAALSTPAQQHNGQFVVIGKIIVDEYGQPPPSSTTTTTTITTAKESTTPTVGGGGPQAAWGAAAALASLSFTPNPSTPKPPSQPVTLLGGVGALDWTHRETSSLSSTLDSCCCNEPIIIPKEGFVTPRIQLWHDENQNIQWFPLNDSFAEKGADGLWFDTPSVQDVSSVIEKLGGGEEEEKMVVVGLHCIVEGGIHGAGRGGDVSPLLDKNILKLVDCISVEPVTFPEETTNQVSEEDATHCAEILQRIINAVATSSSSTKETKKKKKVALFSPDRQLFDALPKKFVQSATFPSADNIVDSFAVRDGPKGSFLRIASKTSNNNNEQTRIPAATLATPNAQPVNPTGAGNAYAAAYAAARSIGQCSPCKAACIATGVGAVVCEYEHLPPWDWGVIERICEAAKEVEEKVGLEVIDDVVD